MLSHERNGLVTGSNAHRVMAGWRDELECNKYVFEPFDGWEIAHKLILGGTTAIKDIKPHVDINMEKKERILKLIKSQDKTLSDGMYGYAMEIAMNHFVETVEEGYKNEAMVNGEINEMASVAAAERYLGFEFDNTGDDQDFYKLDDIGLTPDGVKYNESFLLECGLEVKSPTQKVHFYNVNNIKTQEDLLKYHPVYYWQCMAGLAVTGVNTWHWFSHNDSFIDKMKLVYVKVEPIEEQIEILLRRAKIVKGLSNDIIEKLK